MVTKIRFSGSIRWPKMKKDKFLTPFGLKLGLNLNHLGLNLAEILCNAESYK